MRQLPAALELRPNGTVAAFVDRGDTPDLAAKTLTDLIAEALSVVSPEDGQQDLAALEQMLAGIARGRSARAPAPCGAISALMGCFRLIVLCHKFSRREPSSLHRSRAAWAARQARDDADVETAPHRRDRIGNVPLRPERESLGVDNRWEWKVLG